MPNKSEPRPGERIAKLLARAGVASRREVERMITEGRVTLAGQPVTTPATILASLADVAVDGEPVAAVEPPRLFLFHKPVGLLVTERDPRGRPTIYDRLPDGLPRVMPVGRLDLATEGLLLLTTDGGLKRQLELPATGVERTYRARAYGQIGQAQLEDLIEGIEIEGVRYGRIDANLERRTSANVWIELTLTEGKNREVRRVLEHLGLQVGRLIRTRYGPFVLGDLPPGTVGEVRSHDVDSFRANPTRLDLPQPSRRARQAELRGSGPTPLAISPRPVRGEVRLSTPARTAVPRSASDAPRPPRRQPSSPARTDDGAAIVKAKRADRAAAHRRDRGEAASSTPRPEKPVRKPGWARPKPRPGHGKPRKR